MSKLFKDNIIFHSAYRNRTTLVALFHLSAHVMLLQQHLEIKTNNVQKCLKELTIFYKNRAKAEPATYNQKMFFSPSQFLQQSYRFHQKKKNRQYRLCLMPFQESTLIEIAFSFVNVSRKCQSAKIHITVVHDCANQKKTRKGQADLQELHCLCKKTELILWARCHSVSLKQAWRSAEAT